MHDDDLTAAEREAFAALPRDTPASDLLEERTVRALAARGLIHKRHRIPVSVAWIGAAAACVVFFVAGFSVGQSRSLRPVFPAGTETQESGGAGGTTLVRAQQEPVADKDGPTSVAMDTAGSLALGSAETQAKIRTQVVVWF